MRFSTCVSIHARQFHSGRLVAGVAPTLPARRFQSTPANFTAGDRLQPGRAGGDDGVSIHARQFHSGRQVVAVGQRAQLVVSIHARQFHSGRHWPDATLDLLCGGFNPRPPISQRATAADWVAAVALARFQSTPANFTAGDARCRSGRWRRRRVSIHARQFHSGRRADAGLPRTGHRVVSIHARQFHSGRRSGRASARSTRRCFNPRPPISQRATPVAGAGEGAIRVSIHARQFHSGRRHHLHHLQGDHHVSIHARQFHSGRRRDVRRPAVRIGVSIHARQFHSGRLPRQGIAVYPSRFQSTPANFTAGDGGEGLGAHGSDIVSIHARQFHSGRPSR